MKKIYKKLLSSILLFVLIFSNMFNAAMFSSYGLEQDVSNILKVQTALSKLISRYENFDGTYNEKYDYTESLGARNAGIDILQIRRAMNKYSTFSMSNATKATLALIAAGYNPSDYNGNDYAETIRSKFNDESDPKDLATAILTLDMTKADYDKDAFVKQLIATGKEDWSGEFAFGNSSRYWDDWDMDWVEDYTPSPEYTALVALALSKHKDVDGANETIDKCLAYLKNNLKDNGTVDNSLGSTIYTIQALKSLSIDPYTSSEWISGDSKTLLDGVLECYIEDKGRFANSASGTYPAQMADSLAFMFLSEEVNSSSIYDLEYIAPGNPSYIKTSLADTVDATEDETIEFTAHAYDSNNLPLETKLNMLPGDTNLLSVDSNSVTMKNSGTTKLVISAEGFDSVKKEIIVNIKSLNGLTKEKKEQLTSEILFLKDKYAAYDNYEFLSSPAASLSSMDKKHIKSNLMEYKKVNNLALLTKSAISMIGAGLDPREFTLDGEKKNLIDELKASQIKSGDRKGQFALNPMDFDEAEYQAWAIITLYSANASYDSDAAIDALVKLLDGDYNKSTAYKEIQTEGACLIALGLYRDDSPKAAAKADELISWLMGMQNEDGGFNLAGGYFANSPMATASVIQGLITNNINPMYNPNWIKNENTPLDSLLKCKYESSNVRLQGYAKSEEKIGADYKATYLTFAALVDMLNDESMFKLIKMSPVSVNPGAPSKIEIFGGFKSDAEINSTQYIDAFLFDSNGNLVSQKPSMKILDTDIATISGSEFKALKQGSTKLELKYGSIVKIIDINVSDPEPTVDPDKDKVVLEDKEAMILVRVEGNQGTLSNKQIKYMFTKDSTPFDILKASIGEENIGYEGSHGGEFINSILGESKGAKDGWSYCIKGIDGEISQPMIGVNALKELRNDKNEILYDEFIFYKSYYEQIGNEWVFHTKTPDIKVSVNGNQVSIVVTDKADKSPIEGVAVSSDGVELATTDSNGSATFTLDKEGMQNLSFTRYEGAYATLLKSYMEVNISSEPVVLDDLETSIRVRVEGSQKTLNDSTISYTIAQHSNALDILQQAVGRDNISYSGSDNSFITGILGESQTSNAGWCYVLINTDNELITPQVGANSFSKLRSDDNKALYTDLVFYKSAFQMDDGKYSVETKIPEISISIDFDNISLTITDSDDKSPLENVVISENNTTLDITDSNGFAEFKFDELGEHNLVFSRYENDQATILKSHRNISIDSHGVIDPASTISPLRAFMLKLDSWNYEQAMFYKMTGDSSDSSTIASKIAISEEIKNPTDLSGNIMSLIAADLNPYNYNGRDFVAELIALQHSDGSFKKQNETDNQTIFSVIALDMAEASYEKDAALSYLASKQKDDGSIGFGEDDTGMYLVAVSDSDKYESNRDLALGYLHSKQAENGIINNAYSTAWIIHGLIAIGEDPSSASWTKQRGLVDAFMSHFEEDHFKVVSDWGTDTSFISKQAPLSVAELVSNKSAYKTLKSSYKESIQANTNPIDIEVGETASITASIQDPVGNNVSGKAPVFKSSDSNIANVDSNGLVTAVNPGNATITISHPDDSGINTTVSVNIKEKTVVPADTAFISIKGPEGEILTETEIKINKNDNIISLTKRIFDENSISYDMDSSGYVKSIAGFKEMQYGKNSGWKFYINGQSPDIGASSIAVSKSMNIEWKYVKDDEQQKLEDKKSSIRVRVEGNLSTLFDKTIEYTFTDESTPFDILKKAVGEQNIGYVGENGNEYVVAIFKEGPGSEDGWSYCVKDLDGKSTVPMVGINGFKNLRNKKNEILYNEFIFYKTYYGMVGTEFVMHTKIPEIAISVNENNINVKVTDMDDNSPLEGAVIHADGDKVATTDSNGSANFNIYKKGGCDLTFTRYTDKYSTLLKSHRHIEIHTEKELLKTLTIESSSNRLKVGDTVSLDVSATTSSGSDIDDLIVKWSSSKSKVAKIDQNGLITALSTGNTVIKAVYESVYSETYKQDGYLFDDFDLEIYDIESVSVEKSSIKLVEGESETIDASIKGSLGNIVSGKTPIFKSSDSNVASVDSNGLVTAINPGSVTITVSHPDDSDIHTTVSISVKEKTVLPADTAFISINGPEGKILAETEIEINENDNVLSFTRRVLDKNSISYEIDSSGYVKSIAGFKEMQYGIHSGWKFHIDGKTPNMGALSISVKDSMRIEWTYSQEAKIEEVVKVDKASLEIEKGESASINASILDKLGNAVVGKTPVFKSSDSNVASVDSNGLVTAINPGSVTITVSHPDDSDIHTTVSISVKEKTVLPADTAFISINGPEGKILAETEIEINENDNVLSFTRRVLDENSISYDMKSNKYINSIAGFEEFQYGKSSGWQFHVNGEILNRSVSSIAVERSMKIEWTYTKDPEFILQKAVESLRSYMLTLNEWNYEQALFYKMTGNTSDNSTIGSKISIINEIKEPTELSKNIISLIAADINPYNHDGRNFVDELIALQQSNGSFKITAETDNQTIWSVIALDMADASYNRDAALSYLAAKQNKDGSIGVTIDDVGIYLVILADSDKYASNRDRALTYLHLGQGHDGIINNAYSTSWAIHGLVAIGEDPSSASWTKDRNLTDALMSFFEDDHFKIETEWGTSTQRICQQAPLSIAEVLANKSAYKTIRISSYGERLDVNNTSLELLKNETDSITAEIKDASGNTIAGKTAIFKLSDPSIASFNPSSGVIKGLKLGKCTLTVSHPENPSIRVDVDIEVVNKKDEEIPTEDSASIGVYGPKGKILSRYSMTINKGDNVMSFTKRALDENDIRYDLKDGGGYVAEIAGIKEFQYGKNSGWKFYVDGKAPEVGADSVRVKDSMKIEWRYTTDYKKDSDYKATDEPVDYEEKAQKLVKRIDKLEKEELKERLKDINSLVGRLEREEDARILEGALLDVAKEIQKENTQESKEIMDSIKKVYASSLENFSTVEIDEDNKLDKDKVKESIKLMDRRYEEIQNKLEKADVNGIHLKKELVLDFSELDSKSLTIDSKASSALKDSTSDSISIKTDDAKLELKKDFFEDKDIKLEVSKISTKDHKDITDRGSVIVDIKLDKGRDSVNEFDQPVKIRIPYKGIVVNPDLLCVYYLDDDNKTTKMGGIYDKEDGTITFETTHLSRYFAKVSPALLADSAEKAWAKKSIEKMAAKGILEGYDGKFNPSNNMTKAEFVTMTVRLVNLKSDKNSRPRFADVDSNAWYYKNIQSAIDLELIEDASSPKFNPDTDINREEAAMIVFNALKARKLDTSSVSKSQFADASDISAASMKAVMSLRSQSLLKGDQNNNFNPKAPMTRAECAVFIDRLYDHLMNN